MNMRVSLVNFSQVLVFWCEWREHYVWSDGAMFCIFRNSLRKSANVLWFLESVERMCFDLWRFLLLMWSIADMIVYSSFLVGVTCEFLYSEKLYWWVFDAMVMSLVTGYDLMCQYRLCVTHCWCVFASRLSWIAKVASKWLLFSYVFLMMMR